MKHAAGAVARLGDGVVQRVDGHAGIHRRFDRVPHDPAREHVFDRAEIDLALGDAVLGDDGQAHLVRRVGDEPVRDHPMVVFEVEQVVVDRRTALVAIAAPFVPKHGPPAVAQRDPPRCAIRHRLAGLMRLVGEQPVPDLGVVAVGVEQRVDAIGLHHLA